MARPSSVFVAITAFVAIWLASTSATAETNQSEKDAPKTITGWRLTDHQGRPVREQDLRGRFKLMVFGYTFCPDVCPTALGDISTVMDRLGDQARFVIPVFVTIDPRRDTPPVLAEYVANFHPRTIGLTGTEAQIKSVREAFGVVSVPGPADKDGSYFVAHSALKYLVGPGGEAVHSFSHDDPPDVVVAYLKKLFQRIGI